MSAEIQQFIEQALIFFFAGFAFGLTVRMVKQLFEKIG